MPGRGPALLRGPGLRPRHRQPPQTKWATGSNLAFVGYAADPERDLVIAMGVVDNLGKGAAGQAVQNANLICGLAETAGLEGAPVWP